jgi:hypothetical protein
MARKAYGVMSNPDKANVIPFSHDKKEKELMQNYYQSNTRPINFIDNLTEEIKKYANHTGVVSLNWTAPYLTDSKGRHYWISHYYHSISLAVDKFPRENERAKGYVLEKKSLCNANGIYYISLVPGENLQEALIKAKLQEVKKK